MSRLATIWDLIEVINSYVGHWVSGYYVAMVTIRTNNPVPIHLYRANQNWQINKSGKYLWATYFYDTGWDILNDNSPPTTWIPSPAIDLPPGIQGDYYALFMTQFVALEGNHTVDLIFNDGSHKGVTVNLTTYTPTATPQATNTPLPIATSPTPATSTKTPLATNIPTPIPTWTSVCPSDDDEWPYQPIWTPNP